MKQLFSIIPMLTLSLLLLGCKNTTNTDTLPKPSVDVAPDAKIQSPLTLHINSEGAWMAFEGELGTVSLLDQEGKEISTAIMKSEDGNWMTSESAPFVATLDFSVSEDQPGSLVFKNNFITDEGGNKPQQFEIPVTISATQKAASPMGAIVNTWCFMEKTEAVNAPNGNEFNYQFVQVSVDAENQVAGWMITAPYGTDGMRGNVSGTYDPDSKTLELKVMAMGEGQLYEQERSFKISDDHLQLDYSNPDNTPAQLKQYDCITFEKVFKEYQNGIISNRINTTDRSRLMKIDNLKEIGFTPEQLKSIRFMELETDLNNDYETKEYLIYVMDPMLCGTGGCSLYIVDDKGTTLSYMTVTKLPVYTIMPSMEAYQKNTGTWQDLFVWSNGSFRQLVHDGTTYPNNPSTEPEVSEMEIEYHPEKYRMLLNFLD